MVRRSPTVASRIWPAWTRVAETTEERLGLAQADPGMPGDLAAAGAHVAVDVYSVKGHATIVCSRRLGRIVDRSRTSPQRFPWPPSGRPGVHPKHFTEVGDESQRCRDDGGFEQFGPSTRISAGPAHLQSRLWSALAPPRT